MGMPRFKIKLVGSATNEWINKWEDECSAPSGAAPSSTPTISNADNADAE